jgi:hypothetical protein
MMGAQAGPLGCGADDAVCLCPKPDFFNGINDCAKQNCGVDAAPTVTNYASAFCASKCSKLQLTERFRAPLTWSSCHCGTAGHSASDHKPGSAGDNTSSNAFPFAGSSTRDTLQFSVTSSG